VLTNETASYKPHIFEVVMLNEHVNIEKTWKHFDEELL
jgi:hypothetical protein